MPRRASYDAVVIGGGPAGATVGALTAQRGLDVLVLEKLEPGSFKIGESLMPSTYWTLERLGVLDAMKQSHFPRKYSVQFFSESGKASRPFYFFEENEHESAVTWQVLRSEFDEMLLDAARRQGAEVVRGAVARDVVFEGDRATGVVVGGGSGESAEIGCRVVVDASGQSSLLSRKLGLRRLDPHLRHASIFTHFEGGRRDEGIDEGATLILHTAGARSWFWYIPMPQGRVSVGVVGDVDYLISARSTRPRDTFFDEVRRCEAVRERLEGARQVRDVAVLRDFSYSSSRIAGAGWVLVGDAYSFIDPIYSSGVMLALSSGEMAADSITSALEAGEASAERLGGFRPTLDRGIASIRRLVHAFYSPEFSFAGFLRRYPQHKRDVVDILVGDVFDRDFDELFSHMAEVYPLPELPRVPAAEGNV